MTERVIITVVSLLMLAITLKRGDRLNLILTSSLTFGILLTWANAPLVKTSGLIIYMIIALVISINAIRDNKKSNFIRITIAASGFFAFTSSLFLIFVWPYANLLRLSMIIPISLYLISLNKGLLKSKDTEPITIMNLDLFLKLFG